MSVDAESAFLTDPQEAKRFIELTGVDSLAVAIGTAHGLYTKNPKSTSSVWRKSVKWWIFRWYSMAQAMCLMSMFAAPSNWVCAKSMSLLN